VVIIKTDNLIRMNVGGNNFLIYLNFDGNLIFIIINAATNCINYCIIIIFMFLFIVTDYLHYVCY